ncbi:MAG: ATP-grasp domain-containing protein [Candidatus Omnitrophica bacterium]|nr:ATP-grasp domain-containing protein [Candidatus Omnitrophota bacterium]
MEKKYIAFLYNIRHKYPKLNDARTQLETDFDDPETIMIIIKHLKGCGFRVLPIEANRKAYLKLYRNRNKILLAFNYSEGIYGSDRESHIPSMLEMLQIPYTGSTPLTQALVLNKAKAKEILSANNIPVLPHQLFKNNKEKLNKNLKFPLIVKPVAQGSSSGITNKSVVFNKKQLRRQISFIIETFNQEALVESYLSGREFSVAMLGNPPKILPIIESCHKLLPKGYFHIDSLEVKWLFEEESEFNHLICPAKISKKFKRKIEKICYDVWKALNVRDWCRIDMRCDRKNNPYVLEVNSPPGIIPPEVSNMSYFPLAARAAGMSYKKLLRKIINLAFKRYGIKK